MRSRYASISGGNKAGLVVVIGDGPEIDQCQFCISEKNTQACNAPVAAITIPMRITYRIRSLSIFGMIVCVYILNERKLNKRP